MLQFGDTETLPHCWLMHCRSPDGPDGFISGASEVRNWRSDACIASVAVQTPLTGVCFSERSVFWERKDPLHEAYSSSFSCQRATVHLRWSANIQKNLRTSIVALIFRGNPSPQFLIAQSGFYWNKNLCLSESIHAFTVKEAVMTLKRWGGGGGGSPNIDK